MRTKSCKAKARGLQKSVAEALINAFPHLGNDIKTAIMGESGIDIRLGTEARRSIPFGIECKRQEHLNIWSALEQCEANAARENLHPCLVFKRNRSETYAVVRLSTFIELLKASSKERDAP